MTKRLLGVPKWPCNDKSSFIETTTLRQGRIVYRLINAMQKGGAISADGEQIKALMIPDGHIDTTTTMMLIEPPTVMLMTENGKASNANEALPSHSEIALPPIVLLIRRQNPLPPFAFLFRPIVTPSVVPPRSDKSV
jgi:hypothetical protein